MGVSADAHLIYGVRLGGDDAGWQFDETALSWFPADMDLDKAWLELRLAEVFGQEVTRYDDGSWYIDSDALQAKAGVEIVATQHADFPDLFLAVVNVRAYRGDPKRVEDFTITAEQEAALTRALSALGITPNEPSGWYVASYTDYS
jgi:hypothetical protein